MPSNNTVHDQNEDWAVLTGYANFK